MLGLLKDGSARDVERADPFVIADDQANYAAVAFRKQDDDLKALYDEKFTALKQDGTVANIMAKYGFAEDATVPDTITTEQVCGNGKDAAGK